MPQTHTFAFSAVLAALTCAADSAAQQRHWSRRAVTNRGPGPITYDRDRQRAVSYSAGNTYEWDGLTWSVRDVGSLGLFGSNAIAHHEATGETLIYNGFSSPARWDGREWRYDPGPGPRPVARTQTAMAYDRQRARTLMFGGYDFGYRNDTWEWDGAQWIERSPATSPPPRRDHVLVYDPVRQVIVLFGGNAYLSSRVQYDDTWEWDGTNWTQRVGVGTPNAMFGVPKATYDETRQRVVLLTNDETWEYDGISWVQVTTTPPETGYGTELFFDTRLGLTLANGNHGVVWLWDGSTWIEYDGAREPDGVGFPQARVMVWDSARRRAVLYGFGQTCEWDGVRWRVFTPAVEPDLARYAMAYDPIRNETVLFGGAPWLGSATDQTWTWDGTTWTQLAPSTSPPPRQSAAMAWDPNTQTTILFGGLDSNSTTLTDTWSWDGTNWTQLQPANAPTTSSNLIATDTLRNRIVMPVRNDSTWEWDGTDWTMVGPLPPTSFISTIAFDRSSGNTVAFRGVSGFEWDGSTWTERATNIDPDFGGPVGSGSGLTGPAVFDEILDAVVRVGDNFNQTWVYSANVSATVTSTAAACPGDAPDLVGFGTPWLGNAAFAFDLLGGPSSAPASFLFAFGQQPIPFGGCTVFVDVGLLLAAVPTSTTPNGFANSPLTPPLDPFFLGFELHVQAATLGSGPNPILLTNALTASFGY